VAAKSPRIEAVAISEMRVGDQVPAENPTGELDLEFGDTVDPATWRKVVLLAAKANGSTADIELLRPVDWVDGLQATVGGTIELELAELGVEGPAKVLAIDPCPPIKHNRAFRIVTGTFKHHAGKIIELHLDGVDEPIGTTPNHPFWSEDRQAFVSASDLRPNEQLLGFDGTVRVRQLVELNEPEPVYNLEVQCDHVYHVGKNGLLVHNTCIHLHHGIPRQIIGQASANIRPRLYGMRGMPNRIPVNAKDHIAAHAGRLNGLPKYNPEFQRRLDAIQQVTGRQLGAKDYWQVRSTMLYDYFGF
jgi:hypothetical protein